MPIKVTALLAVAVITAAASGCASKQQEPEAVSSAGGETLYASPKDDRRYATSWSYSTRAGAAVQKAAYQHYLTTNDSIYSPHGRMYPQRTVEPTSNEYPVAVAFPAADAPAIGGTTDIDTLTTLTECPGARILSSAREMTREYIAVRNKLCAGAQRLTYEEWLILVNGTPKDVPAHLQP